MGTEVFICCKGEGELLEIDSIDIEDDDLNPGKRIVILYEE